MSAPNAYTPPVPIAPYFAWTEFTPAVPNLYYDVYSAEERIKKLCMEMHKMVEYANRLGIAINTDHDIINELEVSWTKLLGDGYVPQFADPLEWDNSTDYAPLTIVTYHGNSYTSRQYVPAGTPLTDTDYWVETGNYNAQIEDYRQAVIDTEEVLPKESFSSTNTVKKYIDDENSAQNALLPSASFNSTNTVKKYIDDENSAQDAIIPRDSFSETNTVKGYIDQKNSDMRLYVDGEIDSTNNAIEALNAVMEEDYIPFPESPDSKYGSASQVLSTLANGKTQWVNPINPSDEQAETYITAWLNNHPEATTTVQDNSVTDKKLVQSNGILSVVYQNAPMSQSDWEIGGIDLSSGTNNVSTIRLRTKGYVPAKYIKCSMLENYAAVGFGYDTDGTFLGTWNGSVFGNAAEVLTEFDLKYMRTLASNIRLVLRKTNNTDVSTTDYANAIFFTDTISDLQSKYNELAYDVTNLEEIIILDVDYAETTIDGYVRSTNGTIATSSYYKRTDYIPVAEGINYYYSGTVYSDAGGAAFDYDKNYVGPLLPVTESAETYSDYQLTIPSGSVYIMVSTLASGATLHLVANGTEPDMLAGQLSVLEDKVTNLSDEVESITGLQPWELTTPSLFERIGACGDSYSSGAIYNVPGATGGAHYGMSWVEILGRRSGVTGIPFASPGVNAGDWLEAQNGLAKLKSEPACNLYIVMLGINAETVGSIADVNDSDPTQNADTYYGNMARIYHEINDYAPDAKIIFVRAPITSDEKATAMQTLAARYSIGYFSLVSDPLYSNSFYTDNMSEGHPIGITYAGMALAVERQLCSYIVNNPDYFKNYTGND